MDKNEISLIDKTITKSSVIISIPLLIAFDKMNGNNFIIKKEAFKNYLEKPNVKELFKTGSFYIEDIDIDTIRDYDYKSIFITDLTKTIGTILDINIDEGTSRIKLTDPKYIEKFYKMKNPVLSFIYAVDKFEGKKYYFMEIKNIICMKPCIVEGSESYYYNEINKGEI